jgi:hypothetical protein
MTSTDRFKQRVKECRRLAAAARKGSDRAFWLGLVERWQAVESRTAQRHRLRQDTQAGQGRETAGASPAHAERRSQPRDRLR